MKINNFEYQIQNVLTEKSWIWQVLLFFLFFFELLLCLFSSLRNEKNIQQKPAKMSNDGQLF